MTCFHGNEAKKILRIGDFENSVVLSRPFWIFFSKKNLLHSSVTTLFDPDQTFCTRVYIACLMYWTWAWFHGSTYAPKNCMILRPLCTLFRLEDHLHIIFFVILGDGRHGGYFSHIWTHLSPPWSHFCQRKRNHYYLLCNDSIWQGQLAVKECKSL